ncbi:MAG: hypothetical protein R3E31_19310 [Chloroflexota bacterium]
MDKPCTTKDDEADEKAEVVRIHWFPLSRQRSGSAKEPWHALRLGVIVFLS